MLKSISLYNNIIFKQSIKLFLIILFCFNLTTVIQAATIEYQYSKTVPLNYAIDSQATVPGVWERLHIDGNLILVSSTVNSETLDILDEKGVLKYRFALKSLTGDAYASATKCSLTNLNDGTFLFTCNDTIMRMNLSGQVLFSTVFPYSAEPYYDITFKSALNDRNGGIIIVGEILIGRAKDPIFLTTRYNFSGSRLWYNEVDVSDYDSMLSVTLTSDNKSVNVFNTFRGDDSPDTLGVYNVNVSTGVSTYRQSTGVKDYSLGTHRLDDYNIIFTSGDAGGSGSSRLASELNGFFNGSKTLTKTIYLAGYTAEYGMPKNYNLSGIVKLSNGNILAVASVFNSTYVHKFMFHELDANLNILDYWEAGNSWNDAGGYPFIDSNNNIRIHGRDSINPYYRMIVLSPPPPTLSITGTQTNNTTLGVSHSVVTNGNLIQTYQVFNPDNNVNYYSGSWTNWTKYFDPGTYKFATRLLDSDGSIMVTSNTVTMTVQSPTISISTPHTYIGDNTPHQLAISYNLNGVNLGSLRVVDSNTGAVHYNSTATTAFSGHLTDGMTSLKATLNSTTGGEYASSNIVTIDKQEILGDSLSALKSGAIPTKIILIADKDRYYDNNVTNQALVSQIKSLASGVYIVQNNTTQLFDTLLE